MIDQAAASNPDLGLLADWLEGRLTAEESARIERQVAVDAELGLSARWVRGFLEAVGSIPKAEPSRAVNEQLQQHFARWANAQPAYDESVRHYQADLLFDSTQHGSLVGVRGESDMVKFVFGSEIGDLYIDVCPAGTGSVRLLGQVMLADDTDAPIFTATALWPTGDPQTCESDEFGRFLFSELAAVPSEINVSNGEVELTATLPVDSAADG